MGVTHGKASCGLDKKLLSTGSYNISLFRAAKVVQRLRALVALAQTRVQCPVPTCLTTIS